MDPNTRFLRPMIHNARKMPYHIDGEKLQYAATLLVAPILKYLSSKPAMVYRRCRSNANSRLPISKFNMQCWRYQVISSDQRTKHKRKQRNPILSSLEFCNSCYIVIPKVIVAAQSHGKRPSPRDEKRLGC